MITTLRPPRHPRHRAVAASATLILAAGLVGVAAPAEAKGPVGSCPNVKWMLTTLPAHGFDDRSLLWRLTLAGLIKEFGSIEAGLREFGLSRDAFAAMLTSHALRFDKNGDRKLCMKDQPDTPGFPAYFFNGTDNNSHSNQ